MADGDERTITRGEFAGSIQREISAAAGTTDVTLVPALADKTINLRSCLLNNSVAADLAIKGSSDSTAQLPVTIGAGASLQVEKRDQIRAATAGDALVMTRSASTAIKGYVIYDRS